MKKEPWEIESEGYEAGRNPMMGTFSKMFDFAPVPYGNKGKQDFVTKVHDALSNVKYVYSSEVRLQINLYLDEQKRYETPESADLDNYAKLLCDALKGSNGILVDDTQIQSLTINWIDTGKPPHFEIEFSSHPDDYVMKPVALYEMPDKLFYPLSTNVWTSDGTEEDHEGIKPLLIILHEMTRAAKHFRHKLRQDERGIQRAFQVSRSILPTLKGFHKNRIIDSGFTYYTLEEWKSDMDFEEIHKKLKEFLDK